MPIQNQSPVVIPAAPEKIYDRLAIAGLSFLVTDRATMRTKMASDLVAYRVTTEGLAEWEPNVRISFTDNNLFDLHTRRPDLDAAVGQIVAAFPQIQAAAPSNILAVLELVAQCVGAMAQTPEPVEPSESSDEPVA